MRIISRRLLVALCVLAPATLAARAGALQIDQPQPTFRSQVDLVTIQASVRDRRGRPMKGLTPGDFEVRDNGELRPILSVRADVQSPVSLVVLVDMSGSMRMGSKILMARQAFAAILSQLRAGEDEAAVFTFDSTLHERRPFTRDLSTLADALADFAPYGETSLYDATAETARRLAGRSGLHKAIVVLTDGIDTNSTLSAAEVSALAASIDVPVDAIATVPAIDQAAILDVSSRRSDAGDLRDLTDWTGGQFVFASTPPETAAAAAGLIDSLRQQYVLAIEAAGAHEWRRLDIRVKHSAAIVKTRSGYYGG